MGLKSQEELSQPKFSTEEFLTFPTTTSIDSKTVISSTRKANPQVKAKRKMVKQSRKQNRKKRK